ncbi:MULTISPECIES: LemA family protein [unclassified Campylobacter]|uniref:LemA family protein n=1 Tax=unclassified Campylobacter TaxID=2593542 RepID=UPI0022E9C07C|nr:MULTISPECIES: LemA family protein [unclassified Campylobacter]MDA3053950.1 LemA family protein [Campylobacter sp. VBCF_07 NA4]MDA3060163.1 LemA family protein [Campylobacter sp. VBCF_02 NA5]MDA3069677.1 LemA family protein [Campylobacter sp. VBCF_08 NA3]WBR54990.1 LemA family protein [Campylobacter sp. VBCF_01 NA2]
MSVLLVILAILILVGIFLIGIYNKLVALLNEAKNAFAQIDVQLKRRYDLIPNLIEVVKKYMAHEKQTLENVVNARNRATSALERIKQNGINDSDMRNLASAENELKSALNGLNIQVEAYPELKASENMLHLSEEITSTENKIGFARQSYNDAVTDFNTYKQSFPNNILVGFFPKFHKDLALLEFREENIQKAPKIEF